SLSPRTDAGTLEGILRQNVSDNSFLSGLAHAFEPYQYHPSKRLYCPYLLRKDSGIQKLDVADSYDYTESSWYRTAVEKGANSWTEPYLGGASGILNATFTAPVYHGGKLIGVTAADLDLTALTKELASLDIMGGYVMLISKTGNFISHPRPDWILSKGLADAIGNGNPETKGIFEQMQERPSGIILTKDAKNATQWIVFQQIAATGWRFVAVVPEKNILAGIRSQLLLQMLIMSIALVVIIIVIIFIAIGISKPLQRLSRFAHQIAEGDFEARVQVPDSRDELEELARAFQNMGTELKAQIAHVKEMAEARAKVESELSIARQIQESLLPRVFPPFPTRSEFALYAQMIPARDVAGDFYDFFFLDPNRLVLVIADVSGKGIPAALFMAVTRTLLKTVCDSRKTVSEALTKVNEILSKDNDNCMFTTLFMGLYHVDSGLLCYANAGHLPPLLFGKDGGFRMLESLGDPALGIIEAYRYKQDCTNLEIGDRLVFYTDGVTEALDKSDNFYGLQRFTDILQDTLDKPIEQVQHILQDDLIRFQAGDLADDITLLFFSRKT
ncbi:MAG: SpoIIE family protein phosphatase, partial [Candidatus Cloacimonadaceae bacterium]|nr:SpoIIE family protein phosphatase [Candidatus Cloacimonadaceae bacterium]